MSERSNSISTCNVAICPDSHDGYGLFATCNINSGDIILIDDPLFVCPTDIIGMLNQFEGLSKKELRPLISAQAHVNLLSQLDQEKIRSLSDDNETVESWKWFFSVMKCNAHGVPANSQSSQLDRKTLQPEWAIFPIGLRANHSCQPNAAYRIIPGPQLCYIALQPIKEGEEVCISYIGGLFASTQFRRSRLRNEKLFICQCERCLAPGDPTRCVFCPHCRNDNTKDENKEINERHNNIKGPSEKRLDEGQATEVQGYIQYMGKDKWFCQNCNLIFKDVFSPEVVEATLESLFSQLSLNFAQPSSEEWFSRLNYLYTTSKQILGDLHWLTFACHFLFSRFYVSLGYGQPNFKAAVSNAMLHADAFFLFVQEVCPEALVTDVLPWCSALMRLALWRGNPEFFMKYAQPFLQKLPHVYGHWDPSVVSYIEAYQYIQYCNKMGQSPDSRELLAFAEQSLGHPVNPCGNVSCNAVNGVEIPIWDWRSDCYNSRLKNPLRSRSKHRSKQHRSRSETHKPHCEERKHHRACRDDHHVYRNANKHRCAATTDKIELSVTDFGKQVRFHPSKQRSAKPNKRTSRTPLGKALEERDDDNLQQQPGDPPHRKHHHKRRSRKALEPSLEEPEDSRLKFGGLEEEVAVSGENVDEVKRHSRRYRGRESHVRASNSLSPSIQDKSRILVPNECREVDHLRQGKRSHSTRASSVPVKPNNTCRKYC